MSRSLRFLLPFGAMLAGAAPAFAAQPIAKPLVPIARVDAANRQAVREPAPSAFLNATQVYPWAEGAVYRLYAAPGLVSDIALEPGEALIAVAAGDTVRWVIGDTSSGSGGKRQTHILVKPSGPGLATNLIITTNQRVYFVDLRSTGGTAMAAISWTYPEDALLALKAQAAVAAEAQPVAVQIALQNLNFDYKIEGDSPSWRPTRAFDDGTRTFIEFPPSFGGGEAPPLFLVGSTGKAELVNYRLRGRYYVVDRLFNAAELRLGEKHQQVVQIVREGRGRS